MNGQDVQIIERAWAEDATGETIPGEIVKAILAGESPLRVWRKHREFTLDALAERVGVSKEYLLLPDERTALGKKTRKWVVVAFEITLGSVDGKNLPVKLAKRG